VFIGGSDPTLTHMGDPWIFRTRPNDTYSSKVMADFGVHDLKKTKWAVVYSVDAFGSNGAKLLIEQLKVLGITPVLEQGYNDGQADLTPVVLAIRQSGADIIGTYTTFENDTALLARQLKQFGVAAPWLGSMSVASTTARNLAGPALYGVYAVPDYDASASPQAKKFYDEFGKAYGGKADDNSAWAYDAVTLTAYAMKQAGSTDPVKVRDALHAVKGFEGAEGTYNFDENGDGLRSYNVVRNDNGELVFIRHIAFDK